MHFLALNVQQYLLYSLNGLAGLKFMLDFMMAPAQGFISNLCATIMKTVSYSNCISYISTPILHFACVVERQAPTICIDSLTCRPIQLVI